MFLQDFGDHPNIVKLHNVIKAENDKDIYLVFEFMGKYDRYHKSLFELIGKYDKCHKSFFIKNLRYVVEVNGDVQETSDLD